jgi:molybdenum cofactor biosynthesis protein MoaC
MINITHKNYTLRTAIACATVKTGSTTTVDAVKEGRVPKGDVLAAAKTAALFAAKRTSDMIPDCHPLPIEYTDVRFELQNEQIDIEVEVHTIYKTGVEVEAMHAASVAALTIYDMLKPIDKNLSIEKIALKEKQGGKSQFNKKSGSETMHAAVIVCSDTISAGQKEDRSGKAIVEKLEACEVVVDDYLIIPDDADIIRQHVLSYQQSGIQLVIITGGTGLSNRDVTPEALEPIIERRIPGIEEAIRAYGQQRTPYSMLSRSVAGLIGNTLVLALPGSTKGASESMDAVFPPVLHLFKMVRGGKHQ